LPLLSVALKVGAGLAEIGGGEATARARVRRAPNSSEPALGR
jgi:hypothetical protein